MSSPYVSKKQLEKLLSQSEARLGAAVALLVASLEHSPESEVRITGFTKIEPTNNLDINYDKATDSLTAKLKVAE